MTVLSLPAIGRIAERRCRELNRPVPRGALITYLMDTRGIDADRARAALKLSVTVGHLTNSLNDEGQPCVSAPDGEVPPWLQRRLDRPYQERR